MKLEFYEVSGDAIYPADLQEKPDKFGGMSLHMLETFSKGIVTVPLACGCMHVSIPCTLEDSQRIIVDEGVDINCEKYWCSIHSAEVFFRGTSERVLLPTTFLTKN